MKKTKLNAFRVRRGGAWGVTASALRAALRSGISPSDQYYSGFGARLVRSKR